MEDEAFVYLGKMFTEFKRINKNPFTLNQYDYMVILEFWGYLQTRLTTCLAYLANRENCERLGVNYDDVFHEAQLLSAVCSKVNIPGVQKTDSHNRGNV